MKKEKDKGINLNFGFLDKLMPMLDELSKLQGTKNFKTSKGKEFVVSSNFNVSDLKKSQDFKKEQKKEIRPEAEEKEPMVDLFDEGKFLKVIAELPGTDKKDIKLRLAKNRLIISTKDKKYYKELDISSKVKLTKKWTYKNGVLEINLRKL